MVDDDDIFVYTGGEQQVPRDVRRAKIDESVDTVLRRAFHNCEQLIEVEGHDKLKKVEAAAFNGCRALRWLRKMNGVIEIREGAFLYCRSLADIDFDKLEIIGLGAFTYCHSLRSINLPSVRRVGGCAFSRCEGLTEAVFGETLGRIEGNAFKDCPSLRRIAISLKGGYIATTFDDCYNEDNSDDEDEDNPLDEESDSDDDNSEDDNESDSDEEDDRLIIENGAFKGCEKLSRIDVIGGTYETISSLHMKSWRDEMREEIDRINQTLPEIPASEKTPTSQQWIRSVLDRLGHLKTEHLMLVKEAMTLLELALWKAKLDENGSNIEVSDIDAESVGVARKGHRVTCGADIVIKNVLPFLALK